MSARRCVRAAPVSYTHLDVYKRQGDCHHRSHHRLRAAAGGDDLGVRVEPAAHEIGLLGGQRFAEVLRTPCDRILVVILVGHLRQTVEQLFRRLEEMCIRDSS